MKFAAFVITFNRPQILSATLTKILAQTYPPEKTLVLDNGRSDKSRKVVEPFCNRNVLYVEMNDNLGPAGASAYGLNKLCEEGYDLIYWGDDDDPPKTDDTLERLIALVDFKGRGNIAGVGAFGARWNWQNGKFIRLRDEELRGAVEVDVIPGGGQLIMCSDAIRNAGLPNPLLFFGYEELEYCLRCKTSGYSFFVDGDLMIRYREITGRLNLKKKKNLVPVDKGPRQYYCTRNYIFMMRKIFHCPDLARKELMRSIQRLIASWLRGPSFGLNYTNWQVKGVIDGYLSRLGRRIAPTK